VRVRGIATPSPKTVTPQKTPRTTAPKSTERTAPPPSAATTAPPAGKSDAKRLVALSEPEPVRGYATVGVTWQHGVDYTEDQLAVQVRTQKSGTWSKWITAAYHDDHGPDGGSSEEEARNERPGTDALVIGDVDSVQMRAETTSGIAPPDLKLAVIDPGRGTLVKAGPAIDTSKLPAPPASDTKNASATVPASSDGTAATSGSEAVQDSVSLSAMKVAPKPYIYSRAQWGANEKLRDQSAPSYGTVKAGFIHHTVNANSYTAAQVPSLLRGIYAYHTQSRGWRDIGYNYLVDRFGRIWEGRYGGVTRAVVGAHTLGYNEVSFAMSAIGNFDIAQPPQAVLNAYVNLFAWKLSLYNIRADAPKLWVKNRYLHAINGHRDVGQTACPGRYLYAKIPSIRNAAQAAQNRAQTGVPAPPPPPAPTPPPAPKPNADGFLSPTQTPRPATAQSSALVFPRSLNVVGNANPDLLVKSRSGAVQVVPTGGQTGFKAPVATRGSWSGMDALLAAGDLTGDGRGDVLGRWRASKYTRIYRGDGAGHVVLPGVAPTAVFRKANMILPAGDWNRDGHNDVIMRNAAGQLRLVPGLGGGRFGKPRLLAKRWAGYTSTSVTGDLSGDGRPDVVALRGNGYAYLFTNRSRKLFAVPRARTYVGSQYNSVLGAGRDLTGDAYGDVVLRSSRSGQIAILPGRWGGLDTALLGPFDQAKGLRRLSSGQMTGSGRADVVGTNAAGNRLYVVPNNDLTNVGKPLATNLSAPDATQVLNVGDWNRDGRGDVITRQRGGDALFLRPGRGNGTFGSWVLMSTGWKTISNLAAVGDVTGDKMPDLVGRTRTGKTTIFPGNGSRSFKATVLAPATLRSYNQVGVGTWKAQQLPGTAFISSDGSFVPFIGAGVGDLAGYDWVIGPGDVDGDRRNDLVVRDSAGRLWLLPGTTSGYGARRLISNRFGGYTLGG
jgi:hypothetical protein